MYTTYYLFRYQELVISNDRRTSPLLFGLISLLPGTHDRLLSNITTIHKQTAYFLFRYQELMLSHYHNNNETSPPLSFGNVSSLSGTHTRSPLKQNIKNGQSRVATSPSRLSRTLATQSDFFSGTVDRAR